MIKKGMFVRIKANGLKRTEARQGLADNMLEMQGRIFKVDETDIAQNTYKITGFWFEAIDISEDLEITVPKPQAPILFNPKNIDTGEWKKENKI